jgi:hypothetical protein
MMGVLAALAISLTGNALRTLHFRPPIHAGKPEVELSLELIDPKRAERMLRGQIKNRKFRSNQMAYLTRCFRSNQWVFTGDSIKLTSDGTVVDGQHRLEAVCRTGIGQWFVIVRGVDEDAFPYLDQVARRTASDTLHIADVGDPARLLAAARMALVYANWARGGERRCRGGSGLVGALAPWEEAEVSEQLPGLGNCVTLAKKFSSSLRGLACPAVVSFFLYGAGQDDETEAMQFIKSVAEGANLDSGHPALRCRNTLIKTDQGDRAQQLGLLIKAWNSYREGVRDMKYLAWRSNESPPLFRCPIPVPQLPKRMGATGNAFVQECSERASRVREIETEDRLLEVGNEVL